MLAVREQLTGVVCFYDLPRHSEHPCNTVMSSRLLSARPVPRSVPLYAKDENLVMVTLVKILEYHVKTRVASANHDSTAVSTQQAFARSFLKQYSPIPCRQVFEISASVAD